MALYRSKAQFMTRRICKCIFIRNRSKSFNFTNLYDLAVNVHPEEITNSVEYLMDGIAEFREKDSKYSLRLKGFKQGVVSKDWIEYTCQGRNLVLTSSFHEQRIL